MASGAADHHCAAGSTTSHLRLIPTFKDDVHTPHSTLMLPHALELYPTPRCFADEYTENAGGRLVPPTSTTTSTTTCGEPPAPTSLPDGSQLSTGDMLHLCAARVAATLARSSCGLT